ncbi:unnamed protein product, partial [Mesorhabditis belari]|uniref:MARVEL domain-containing protein n=1 Tax=Mesorhabditis belari TaxID=2138241 RepID=A0AAF3J3G3_9BILA
MRSSVAAQYTTSWGPVRIQDAQAYRNDPDFLHLQGPHTSQGPSTGHPPLLGPPRGAAYFMGYTHEPYGQHAYVEQMSAGGSNGDGQTAIGGYFNQQQYQYAYHGAQYYPGYSYTPYGGPSATAQQQSGGATIGGAYAAYPSQSTAYRPYPQPSPPNRRSRTAPARNRPTAPPPPLPTYPTMQRTMKPRGYSADPLERSRFAYSGPFKRPQPLYRKRRDPRGGGYFQETDFGAGAPIDYGMGFQRPVYPPYLEQGVPTTMRRIRPYYAPSYTTYPPSTMHRPKRKHKPEKYPIIFRAVLKAAQLIIGAAILGLVLSPMRTSPGFHAFVVRTKTEWQGAVVGITATFSILTLTLLATSFCLAHKVAAWRRFDALISMAAAFCYLVAGFIEAYFAACYPPDGKNLNLVCHRPEWIIATILVFINVVAYIIDFWLAWAAGVTLL